MFHQNTLAMYHYTLKISCEVTLASTRTVKATLVQEINAPTLHDVRELFYETITDALNDRHAKIFSISLQESPKD